MAQMPRPDLLARLKAEKARPHHSAVAHRALPAAFFADPQMFLEAATRACPSFFERLWVQIGKKLAKPDRLPATGLDCQVRRSPDDVAVAVITLPAPAFLTHAQFVAPAFRA